ncbi:MAG: hypothetical protein AAFR71_05565 [Pseudomonadota bacterium]
MSNVRTATIGFCPARYSAARSFVFAPYRHRKAIEIASKITKSGAWASDGAMMNLSDDCLKSMCTIAIGAGAFAAGLSGVTVAAGAMEIMTASGHLALDLRKSQQKEFNALESCVRKQVERDYKTWLKNECGDDWAKRADVNAALVQLDNALHRARPTVTDMVASGHNPVILSETLLERLPQSDLFRSNEIARSVFTTVMAGLHGLARTDEKLKPLFDSLSWQRAFDEFQNAQDDRDKKHRETLDAIHNNTGIPLRTLQPIFDAIEEEFPEEDIEAKVREAVARLKALAEREIHVGNLGDDVRALIENARNTLLQTADVDEATASFDDEFAKADSQMLRAAALAEEKARMFAAVFRFDDAIRHFEMATRYNPDDAWPWSEIGDIRLSRGNLAAALVEYEKGKSVAERTGNERDLSVSHNRIGDVERARGNGDAALAAYQAGLAIREKLAAQAPTNSEWQRDLSVSHNKIGDVEVARGNGDAALAAYQASHAIFDKLAAQDPTNSEWQRDLSVSHERIGDMLLAEGKLDAAYKQYKLSLDRMIPIRDADMTNAELQRFTSVTLTKIGDVERARGNGDAALAAYHASHAIFDKLAAQDPTNSVWQRDLSVSHEKIGDVEVARGNGDAALAAFQASHAIFEKLAAQDPTNVEWQYDLFVSYWRMTNMEPNPSKQIEYLTAGLERLEALHAENRLPPIHVEWIQRTKDRIDSIKGE